MSYKEALKDARSLIYELTREAQIACEKDNFRQDFTHGLFVGYSTSLLLIDKLIREYVPENVNA